MRYRQWDRRLGSASDIQKMSGKWCQTSDICSGLTSRTSPPSPWCPAARRTSLSRRRPSFRSTKTRRKWHQLYLYNPRHNLFWCFEFANVSESFSWIYWASELKLSWRVHQSHTQKRWIYEVNATRQNPVVLSVAWALVDNVCFPSVLWIWSHKPHLFR